MFVEASSKDTSQSGVVVGTVDMIPVKVYMLLLLVFWVWVPPGAHFTRSFVLANMVARDFECRYSRLKL